MAQLINKFEKINRFKAGVDVDVVLLQEPTVETGIEKSEGQTGIFVHSEGGEYSVYFYNTDTSSWELYGAVSAENTSINLQWAPHHSAVAFTTTIPEHVFRVVGLSGDIIIDSDLTDGISSEGDSLVVSQNSYALKTVQLAASAAVNSSIPSSGKSKWSNWMGQAPGFQAGNMEYGGASTYGEATQLTFHKEDANGDDQSTFLDQYLNAKSGQIKTILDANPGHNNVYQIVGASIDANGNYVFDVYNVSYDQIAVNTGSTEVYFVLVGAEGAKGDDGADGTSVKYATTFNGPHSLGDDRNPGNVTLGSVTVDTGLSYQSGDYAIVSLDASPDNFDIVQVTSYDSATGVITWNNIYQSTQSSFSSNWNINLTGIPGLKGDDGATGPQGPAGADGNNAYTDSDVADYLNGNLDGHIIPSANAQYDLGNAEYKIRHLFLSDNSMYIGDTWIKAEGDQIKTPNLLVGDINLNNEGRENEVDGTSGHWSIQEGSDDLFLINRKTGKKYKFNLTEM